MAPDSDNLSLQGATSAEMDREFRVLTQSLSMHSMLRDRYTSRALVLDLTLLGAALVFAVSTFASDATFALLGATPAHTKIALGIASSAAFFGSIIDLRVDWKGRAALHREAVRQLTDLLGRFRSAQRPNSTWDASLIDDLLRRYWEVANATVEIPEKDFPSLKSRHVRKVQLSKMIDDAPGAPVWLLRLTIMNRSVRAALYPKRDQEKIGG